MGRAKPFTKRTTINGYNKMRFSMKKLIGLVHSHSQEKARRKRQIEKGMLKVDNGVIG